MNSDTSDDFDISYLNNNNNNNINMEKKTNENPKKPNFTTETDFHLNYLANPDKIRLDMNNDIPKVSDDDDDNSETNVSNLLNGINSDNNNNSSDTSIVIDDDDDDDDDNSSSNKSNPHVNILKSNNSRNHIIFNRDRKIKNGVINLKNSSCVLSNVDNILNRSFSIIIGYKAKLVDNGILLNIDSNNEIVSDNYKGGISISLNSDIDINNNNEPDFEYQSMLHKTNYANQMILSLISQIIMQNPTLIINNSNNDNDNNDAIRPIMRYAISFAQIGPLFVAQSYFNQFIFIYVFYNYNSDYSES